MRKLYPGHTVVASQTGVASILGYPAAYVQSLRPDLIVSQSIFIPFARRMGTPGTLVEAVSYGCFQVSWEVGSIFNGAKMLTNSPPEICLQTLYRYSRIPLASVATATNEVLKFLRGYSQLSFQFLVHEGTSEQPSKDLLIAAGGWAHALHDEIWVFNQGFWDKDRGLWEEVQKANWTDVILNEDFKTMLQKDVFGFFSSERVYLDLQIPWKVLLSLGVLTRA